MTKHDVSWSIMQYWGVILPGDDLESHGDEPLGSFIFAPPTPKADALSVWTLLLPRTK